MTEVLQPSTPAPDALARLRARLELLVASTAPALCLVIALDRLERLKDDAIRAEAQRGLEAHLRERSELAGAWFGRCGDRTWCVAPGIAIKDAPAMARSLVEAVRKARLGGQHSTISVGVAVNRPGVRVEVLIKVAEEGLTVAKNGGGDRAVHTDLYDLLQKKLTGAGLPALKDISPLVRASMREVELPSLAKLAPATGTASAPTLPPAIVTSSVQPPPPAIERARDDHVELLERRIAKLLSELAQAEGRIAQLEHSTSGGLASIYREVQGLAPTERLFEQKRNLMASIFEANLALRARAAS